MTVKELKEYLSNFDDNLEVVIKKNLGGSIGCIERIYKDEYECSKYDTTAYKDIYGIYFKPCLVLSDN